MCELIFRIATQSNSPFVGASAFGKLYNIWKIEKGCDHRKKAFKLAKEAKEKQNRKPKKILI